MQPFAFCNRCRGMKVGLNQQYMIHCLICRQSLSKTSKLFILSILLSILVFSFPATGGLVLSDSAVAETSPEPVVQTSMVTPVAPAAAAALGELMARYQVDESNRTRVAEAIIRSSRKHNLDPRLVASIMIIESRANPFAISPSDSVGIMQIHLPTWGQKADTEGINLFRIEDNVEFGVRILRSYVKQYGLWDGVKRYKGWLNNPTSEQNADQYVAKVQRIYGYQKPVEVEALQ